MFNARRTGLAPRAVVAHASSSIAMSHQKNSGLQAALMLNGGLLIRFLPINSPFAVGPLSLAPCSLRQGLREWPQTATLDAAARGADPDRPTALTVSG